MDQLVHVLCPLCEGENRARILLHARDYLFSQREFRIVRCTQCGLAHTSPRVADADLPGYYFRDYGPYQRRERRLGAFLRRWARGAGSPLGRLLKAHGVRSVLDAGCGAGALLRQLRDEGFTVAGVDLDERCVTRIQREGIECYQGDVDAVVQRLEPGSYDAVLFRHVLEHLYHPVTTLRRLHGVLKGGGILYITVPDFGSWEARIFGRYWRGLDLPRHVCHFDVPTLSRLLQKTGFDLLQVRPEPFVSSPLESLGFAAFRGPMPGALYRLLYYPLKPLAHLLAALHLSGAMTAVARRR